MTRRPRKIKCVRHQRHLWSKFHNRLIHAQKRLKLSCLKNMSNRNVFAEYICILYSVFAEYHFSFTCKDHGTHQLRFCFDFHRWCWLLLLLFCCCSNGCIRNGSVIQIFTVNRFNGEWFVFVGSLVCTLKKIKAI